ncbi:unnamed protein product [Clavelina lepadiformis]|uniref:Uncharacterized protein n=1 Tax=Clavelina lepadiformis TaxID=159417 RepID=A0ABP0F562_CLALP
MSSSGRMIFPKKGRVLRPVMIRIRKMYTTCNRNDTPTTQGLMNHSLLPHGLVLSVLGNNAVFISAALYVARMTGYIHSATTTTKASCAIAEWQYHNALFASFSFGYFVKLVQ